MATQVMEAVFKASGVSGFQKAFAQAEASVKKFEQVGKQIKDIGGTMTKYVSLPLIAMGGFAIKAGMDFESSMSTVQALSGATGDDLQKLEAIAREMGSTTRYSASESADALGYMALAGWETEEMIAALPSVLNLATAGNLDLARASDVVTDMMSMFGLEAEEASRASDVFAAAQANSNLNVDQLSEALINAGPQASSLGMTLEDTSAILGIFANNGLKGSKAGTALDAMLRDVQESAENGAIAIGDTSIAVYDAEGNFRGMSAIMQDVEKATEGMTDEQRRSALSSVFQQQSLRGVNLLLQSGTDELGILEDQLYNSTGAAEEMAGIMDDNMQGSLFGLKSAVEEIGIAFFDMSEGPLRGLIDKATEMVRAFGNMDESTQQTIFILAGLAAALGPILMIFGPIISGLGVLVGAFLTFFTTLTTGVGVVAAFKAAMLTIMGPVGWIIAGITALIAVGVLLWKNWETISEKAHEIWGAIADWFSEIWTSIAESASEIWGGITTFFSETWETITETVQTAWEFITNLLEVGWLFIQELFNLYVDLIMIPWNFLWENFGDPLTEAWETIKSYLSATLETISNWITEKWNAIKTVTTTIWNAIKTVLITVWNAIKTLVSTAVTAVSTKVSAVWGSIKGVTSSIWNSIKSTISGVWESIKSGVSNATESVKTTVSGAWDAVKTKTSEVWSSLKEAITTPINSAKDTVKGAIDKMKGFMDFSWSLPKLKMPHFTKSGKFSLNPPSVPKFGVEWYKDGGIMTSATAFGMNGNNVMVGGEAGREAILPLNRSVLGDIGRGIVAATKTPENRNEVSPQPAYINVNIGGQNFRGFVENISNEQGKITDLDLAF